MNDAPENTKSPETDTGSSRFTYLADKELQHVSKSHQRRGLCHFVTELRRRRVCRAATVYAVTMWLVCEVAELIYPELGLPDWTLKFVIVLGLLGFPIMLCLSWLIDITPNGLVLDGAYSSHGLSEKEPRALDRVIDCSLVLAAVIIGIQLASGVLSAETSPSYAQKMAVIPFRVATDNEADGLSQGLITELQYELVRQTLVTVIAPRAPYLTKDSLCLTGAVAVSETHVRVTATMIDDDVGAVTWSQVFERPRGDLLTAPAEFAREIVAALPLAKRARTGNAVSPESHPGTYL